MKKVNFLLLAAVAVYLLTAPLASAQDKGSKDVEEQIKTLTDQLVHAFLKGDTTFIEKYLADDYTAIHGDGSIHTKTQEIGALKSGAIKYEALDLRDSKIRVYGNTAVVTYLASFKGTINGKPYKGDIRSTRIWVKEKGNWKSVALQATRVAR